MDAEQKRRRAGEAQRLLEDPLLTEILDRLERSAIDGLLAVESDLEMHTKNIVLVERMRAVDWVRAGLQGVVNEHARAEHAIYNIV